MTLNVCILLTFYVCILLTYAVPFDACRVEFRTIRAEGTAGNEGRHVDGVSLLA